MKLNISHLLSRKNLKIYRALGVMGFFLALLVFSEIGLRLRGPLKKKFSQDLNSTTKILLYGDSVSEHLADLLTKELNSLPLKNAVQIIDFAGPAMTTETIISRLPDDLERWRPHLVLAMIGRGDRILPASRNADWSQNFKVLRFLAYLTSETRNAVFSLDLWGRAVSSIIYRISNPNCCKRLGIWSTRMAFQFEQSGNLDMAGRFFENGNFLHDSAWTSSKAGWFYYGQGNWEKVRFFFEKNLLLEPDCLSCINALVWAYRQMENLEEGARFLTDLREKSAYESIIQSYIFAFQEKAAPIPPNLDNENPEDLDIQTAKQAAVTYIASLIHGGQKSEAKKFFLNMGPEYAVRHKKITYDNLKKISDILEKRNTPFFYMQYPFDVADGLAEEMRKRHANFGIVELKRVFDQELSARPGLELLDLFEEDFNHITHKARLLITRELASLLKSHLL